jgi:sphingomyelin phosphodiesterase acid-like 3
LVLASLALVVPPSASIAASASDQTWLVVSDIHLNPFDRDDYPARVGSDTNLALFDQTIAQMKHSVPNPSMVLLPGDFLVHSFPTRAHNGAPSASVAESALRTVQRIATALGKTYPQARFAIALGNNDASCGDYRTDAGDAYLRGLARIWEPLIDRGGAAPKFVRAFSAGGYYAMPTTQPGLRLIVLNTVPMSLEYRGNCAPPASNVARNELAWFHSQLAATPPGTHNVVMMHIPPGYDPVSTQYAHGFLAWSFLQGGYNSTLVGMLGAPSSRVQYAIAGHLHHFDFRLDRDVPILIFGSLSPVYRNNPAFYALHVGADGTIGDIDTYAYDEWSGDWADGARSFDKQWNVPRIDAQSLAELHTRLGSDEALRAQWSLGSVAWPSNPQWRWVLWTSRWRTPWCAQTIFGTSYAQCAGIGGRVTAFRVVLIAVAIGIAIAIVLLLTVGRRRRRAR